MSCSTCNKLRERIQRLESNIEKMTDITNSYKVCSCSKTLLIKNSSGPKDQKLCTICAGWK